MTKPYLLKAIWSFVLVSSMSMPGISQDVDSLLAVLHRTNDPHEQAQLNMEIGRLMYNQRDSAAFEFLRRAVMLSDQEKEPLIEMGSRYMLFLQLKRERKFDAAIEQVDRAIAQAKIAEVRVNEAQYTYQKARALRKSGHSEKIPSALQGCAATVHSDQRFRKH